MHRMEKAPLIDASDDPRMVGESSSAGARAASIDRSVLSVFGGRPPLTAGAPTASWGARWREREREVPPR